MTMNAAFPATSDFECPTCGAEPGDPCVTLYSASYKYAATAHRPRIRLMLAAVDAMAVPHEGSTDG